MGNLPKKLRNLIITVLCLCTLFSISAFAGEGRNSEDSAAIQNDNLQIDHSETELKQLVGLTYGNERGYEPPSKAGAQNLTEDSLSFSGYASNTADTLYTNKCFYGKKSVTLTVKNDSTGKLKVTVYKKGILSSKVKTITVDANDEITVTLDKLDEDAYYYIGFTPKTMPLNFEGSVK